MAQEKELKGPRFCLSIEDEGYPQILRESPHPPGVLYGIGNVSALVPGIGIVGARKATPYGLECTRLIARRAALRGLVLVSGGARGCDQVAHGVAVEMEVPTVVVFGSGADVVYPKSGYELFQRVIDQGGAIVSEQPWGTKPQRGMFPRRNRIIAGLSALLVVAEAGLPSGTFSTADAALAAGRDVAVVPGSILSPYSKGTNYLMSQGASPIIDECAIDDLLDSVMKEYPLSLMEAPSSPRDFCLNFPNDPVLQALTSEAMSPHDIAASFNLSPSQALARISQYEIVGMVERCHDGRYQAVRART